MDNELVKLAQRKCLRCKHSWIQRQAQLPNQCPNCHSPYWNTPKWKIDGPGIRKEDVSRLVRCISTLPPIDPKQDVVFRSSAEKVLDCVLSLNRRYNEFVVPRVGRFKECFPTVNSLDELKACIVSVGGPVNLYNSYLDYDYPDAAIMFGNVLDYLLSVYVRYPGVNEEEKLKAWACSLHADGYKNIWRDVNGEWDNIPFFSIAGWQYLRMLFGADTCKPDIAVKRFVKSCLGKGVSELTVVRLIEAAAPEALKGHPQPVREADRRIWHKFNSEQATEKKRTNNVTCHSHTTE